MNLKAFSSENLMIELKKLVNEERAITTQILHFLLEVESRYLFAELGYSSLYEFCMKELGYCQGSAYLRISAMRLLKKLPEAEKKIAESKIKSGELNLSKLSMVHTHLNQQQKATGIKSTSSEMIELLSKVESKSTREVEKILMEQTPEIAPREKLKLVSMSQTQITFTVSDPVMEKLKRVRDIRAHIDCTENHAELFERMLDFYLQHKDPMVKASKNLKKSLNDRPELVVSIEEKLTDMNVSKKPTDLDQKIHAQSLIPNSPRSRFTPAAVKHVVRSRDHGQCTYIHFETGKRCLSTYGLELDHVKAYGQGGENSAENLRLRCKSHNTLHALKTYGQCYQNNLLEGRIASTY